MKYLSVSQIAKKWKLSERSVRNYCFQGRISGAFIDGKTWKIPKEATKPNRLNKKVDNPMTLLDILRIEKKSKLSGGIYHKIQIELTYNSNHIEGSCLTHDETRYIFETNTIGIDKKTINVDDIIETVNHFKCIDMIIDNANKNISEKLIKNLHKILKNSTSDSKKDWFAVGEYKKLPNTVGDILTTQPNEVEKKMKKLITQYNAKKTKSLDDLLDFHYKFECIHPFQDGNGRIGRLLLFKECLKNNIVPFIIDEHLKLFYYRGLKEWENERGFLREACLVAQDKFKIYLNYFKIKC